jgi:hypothetical protein
MEMERGMGRDVSARDPRDPPFTPEERDAAAEALLDKRRWHRRNRADWLAMRLLYGRGREAGEVAAAFGAGRATVQQRAKDGEWTHAMTEGDRRSMARVVWLAGVARLARGEAVDFGALRAASEWRVAPKVAEKPLWVSSAAEAGSAANESAAMRISDEGFDDDYGADPKREERETIRRKLDELLERLEADRQRADEDGAGPEGGGDAGGGGEISGADGAGVAGVG